MRNQEVNLEPLVDDRTVTAEPLLFSTDLSKKLLRFITHRVTSDNSYAILAGYCRIFPNDLLQNGRCLCIAVFSMQEFC